MREKVKQALIDIVGKQNYTDSLIDIISFSSDASEEYSRPACGVWCQL